MQLKQSHLSRHPWHLFRCLNVQMKYSIKYWRNWWHTFLFNICVLHNHFEIIGDSIPEQAHVKSRLLLKFDIENIMWIVKFWTKLLNFLYNSSYHRLAEYFSEKVLQMKVFFRTIKIVCESFSECYLCDGDCYSKMPEDMFLLSWCAYIT